MKVLIKNATIVDSRNPLNGKKRDILITNGTIEQIATNISEPKAKVVKSNNLHVSIGWFDFRAQLNDPGYEYKEDIESGLNAAAKGGFTAIAVLPNTKPVVDSKSGVNYAIQQSQNHLVDLYPYGTISRKAKGENLAELFDMKQAGAIAFTDGNQSVKDTSMMYRGLLYSKGFDGLILNMPNDESLSAEGKMNEGEISTMLGLKGLPSIAEELMIVRDLYLNEYTNGKLHIGPISSQKAVKLIKQGKKEQASLSSETTIMNLIFTDQVLEGFDSNFKLFPPLRTKADQKALLKGLLDDTIDVLSSNHTPENIENKDVEFDYASFGIIMLETFYALYNEHISEQLPHDKFVDKAAINPREILGIETPEILVGNSANLTCFDPTVKWVYSSDSKISKSSNSPFLNQELLGKVLAVFNHKQAVYF